MENLVAFAEALSAPITGQPNMRNYLPSEAKAGARGKVYTGITFNWAPVESGVVTCLQADETSWRFKVEIDKVRPGTHDVGLRIINSRSAEFTYYNTGQTIRMEMQAHPDALFFKDPQSGLIVEQRRTGREVRFWVKDIPGSPVNVSCHLSF
jgi:hypothetical protein